MFLENWFESVCVCEHVPATDERRNVALASAHDSAIELHCRLFHSIDSVSVPVDWSRHHRWFLFASKKSIVHVVNGTLSLRAGDPVVLSYD